MSTTVVLPLVPVMAATRIPDPSSSRPKPTSETTGTPRSSAARNTGSRGWMPGLTTTRSTPSRIPGSAPRAPSMPSSTSVPRRRSSSLASAARISSPRSSSTLVTAIPDSPSPYTRVLTGSPHRVVEEKIVEEEAERCEGGLGDPEPDHDLVLLPAQELEVVVDGRHLEDPASRQLEYDDLDDHRERLQHEEPPYHRQQEFGLGQNRGGGQHSPDGERPRVAHEDIRRVRVVPEKPDDSSNHSPADNGDIVLALEESDGRVGQERQGAGTGREPVEPVRKVDGVGRPEDHEQQEDAEERDPHHPRPQHAIAVETGDHDVLGDAHVTYREDVGQHDRQGQEQELVTDAQA